PSSSKRSSSFADSTQSTTPKPQPTRPADPPSSLRLPLPEHPPGQRTLLPHPPLLSDAASVPQRSRSYLLLESHRNPRRSSSSFAAPDFSPRGAGARRLAWGRSPRLRRAQPRRPRPLLARHPRPGGQPVLRRRHHAKPREQGRGLACL